MIYKFTVSFNACQSCKDRRKIERLGLKNTKTVVFRDSRSSLPSGSALPVSAISGNLLEHNGS